MKKTFYPPLLLGLLVCIGVWWMMPDRESQVSVSSHLDSGARASRQSPDRRHTAAVSPEAGGREERRAASQRNDRSVAIRGVVLGDGVLLVGALVYVLPASATASFLPSRHQVSASSPVPMSPAVAETVSGPGGAFVLSIPEDWRLRRVDVLSRRRGYTRGGIQAVVPASSQGPLEIHLSRGLSIRGRAVSETGENTSGIVIMATTDSIAAGRSLRMIAWRGRQQQARPFLGDDYAYSETRTGEDGRFEIRGLFRGKYHLNVFSEDWLMQPHEAVRAGDSDIVLRVGRGYRFEIEVKDRDSRAPIDRFLLSGSILGGGPGLGLTGKNGRLGFVCRLARRSPKERSSALEMKGEITARGFLPQEVHLHSEPGKRAAILVLLEKPTTVRFPVRITDSENKIVEGARVRYTALDKNAFLDCPVQKDDAGKQFLRLPKGRWQLYVRHPRLFPAGSPWQRTVDVPEPTASLFRRALPIQLDTRARLTLDLSGVLRQETISYISFSSTRYNAVLERPLGTADGRIHWFGLPKGRWTIQVQTKGGVPMRKEILIDGTKAWVVF